MQCFHRSILFILLLVPVIAKGGVTQFADVAVTKTAPAQAASDSDVTYDLVVTNFGPDSITTLQLNDTVPPGMTFISEVHDPAFSCSAPAMGGTGTVTCSSTTLATGVPANFTFVFHINPATPPGTFFTNIATVSEPTDPNDENNSAVAVTQTPPPPQSDLGVTKVGPSFGGTDADVSYTLTFVNAGPDDATTAVFSDTLPGTMTFVSLTQTTGPAIACSTPSGGSGGTITCNPALSPANTLARFTLVVHIPPGTPGGTIYTNKLTASGTDDPSPENNTTQTTLSVATIDVSVTKTGPGNTTAATPVAYTITVANAGPDAAPNVLLSDVLPAGTTFVSLVHDSGPVPAFCTTPPAGQNGQITCAFATLASVASSQFTLTIDSGSAAAIDNTANVTTDGFDTNLANNTSTASTTVTQSADLSVTKSGPPTVIPGTDVTYTVTVTNAGPSDAASVSLDDTLAPGLTFVSATQTSGPSFNCTGGATIHCTIALFPAGSTATFDVVAHLASSTLDGASIDNTATAGSSTSDPNSGNNSSTTTATAAASADVRVTKNGPAAVAPGNDITYTVTVANAGPSDAATVQLTDTVPTGTTFVSANQTSGPTFLCVTPAVGATGTITCSIATLAAGASATFDFTMHVDPASTGTITNTANVTAATTDPAPGNGTSASPAIVSPATTDLSITKTTNSTRVAPNSNVTYTITATNNGPAVGTNVVVTDTLPAGTTLVSATPSQGSCSGTTTVTCNLGVLLSNTSATISLVITMPAAFGPVDNTATVTSDNADSNPGNNSATASVAVSPEIPSLSPLALALLALMLAVVGLFVTRMP
jgi:uncharacterized repeat protein (TIGR01451 family)